MAGAAGDVWQCQHQWPRSPGVAMGCRVRVYRARASIGDGRGEWSPITLQVNADRKQSAIRHRLEVRYRAETCMLTMKRLEVLSEEWRGGGYGRFGVRIGRKSAERMRRLHEMCREWS
jgi:hypothetical protein